MSARTLLFTGKGGVGKTTVAAATALRCAALGRRTLVISTDPAHSLADAFDRPLGPDVEPVAPGLWGYQQDAQRRMEQSWAEIRAYLIEVFDAAGVEGLAAEELAVVPGLDEVFALTDIRRFATGDRWDVVVVDCAPTAETIRLLSLPDVLEWYMERVFPVGRRVTRMVAPVLSRVSSLPVAGDGVFGAVQALYGQLAGVKEILSDPRRSSIRLVVNPERMVVAEARRTHTYLSLFGYPVDAVVANRVLRSSAAGGDPPWLARWADIHADHLAAIDEAFSPLPVRPVGWAPAEPVGLDALAELATELYGDGDPAAVLHEGEPFAVSREDGRYVLRLDLPFATHDEVEVAHQPGEVLVRVGPYRRSLLLPDSLRRRDVAGARLADGVLRISFEDRPGAAPAPGPTAPRPAAVAGAGR